MKKTKPISAKIELNADEKEILTKACKILEEISNFIAENADNVVISEDIENTINDIYNFSENCYFLDNTI